MSDQHQEQAGFVVDSGGTPTVGRLLRRAREARGESLSDVAHALKLSQRQIEAMELERFDLLPGPAFVRGFVRNYARYVGMDADRLLDHLHGGEPTQAVRLSPVTNATGDMPNGGRERKLMKPAMFVVSVLLFVLLTGWYFDWFRMSGDQSVAPPLAGTDAPAPLVVSPPAFTPLAVPPSMSTIPSSEAPSVEVPSSEASSSGALRSDTPAVVADIAADVAPSDGERAMVSEGQPIDEAVEPSPASVAAVDGAVATEAPSQAAGVDGAAESTEAGPIAGSSLVFNLRGESWIQVRDAEGDALFTGTGAPGTTRTVQGKPPFAIVVGNAGMVSLEFDGVPVDLSPHIGASGVARMTVR
ncbi:RodZ domain-containing protein [Rhodocyclaceae bacterium SMB388]